MQQEEENVERKVLNRLKFKCKVYFKKVRGLFVKWL